jgi:MerR family transcriptional regulator, copper efflux regulator
MLLISQLAKQTATPVHTIRYYEKYGLFKGKKNTTVKSNNYTWYDEEVVDKLELIDEAKAIGFSLSEIKTLIDAWYSKRLSMEKKKEVLENKIKEIEAKIAQLKNVKKLIREGIREVEEGLC